MDAETRAQYEAWMWRRIFKRVIIPGVALLVLLIVIIFGLRSCGNDYEEGQDPNYSTEVDSTEVATE